MYRKIAINWSEFICRGLCDVLDGFDVKQITREIHFYLDALNAVERIIHADKIFKVQEQRADSQRKTYLTLIQKQLEARKLFIYFHIKPLRSPFNSLRATIKSFP